MSYPESAAEAWRLRFGSPSPEAADDLKDYLIHRSVRQFAERPVEEETILALMGAAQSAATSSNLNLWSVISVQDQERRSKIALLCGDQEQVRQAPWFFAFLADHARIREAAKQVGEDAAGLGYAEYFVMAVIDAALAAERFVCAAESLGLGVCYIGALRNQAEEVKTLLNLPPGVFGVFGLCLGWPEQPLQAHIKPRMNQENVWFRETYPPSLDLSDFEARMKAFYGSENMKGDATWSKRSGRRVDRNHLSGRETLRAWLVEQGMNLE